MSASLVGSEMCIRDRCMACTKVAGGRSRARCHLARQVPMEIGSTYVDMASGLSSPSTSIVAQCG
eukprot:14806478-Alexandrium_andersonii.AAC.1